MISALLFFFLSLLPSLSRLTILIAWLWFLHRAAQFYSMLIRPALGYLEWRFAGVLLHVDDAYHRTIGRWIVAERL